MKKTNDTDTVSIRINSDGIQRFFVSAESEQATRDGFKLLERVVPELRRLDEAIRRERV